MSNSRKLKSKKRKRKRLKKLERAYVAEEDRRVRERLRGELSGLGELYD